MATSPMTLPNWWIKQSTSLMGASLLPMFALRRLELNERGQGTMKQKPHHPCQLRQEQAQQLRKQVQAQQLCQQVQPKQLCQQVQPYQLCQEQPKQLCLALVLPCSRQRLQCLQ